MTRQEVLTRLCSLAAEVGDGVFDNSHSYDCFCGHNKLSSKLSFMFDEPVIEFIEQAVREKMSK